MFASPRGKFVHACMFHFLQQANVCTHVSFLAASKFVHACMFHFLQQANVCMHVSLLAAGKFVHACMFHFLQQTNLCTLGKFGKICALLAVYKFASACLLLHALLSLGEKRSC